MITITLNEILNANPCADGFLQLLRARGKITTEQLEDFSNDDYKSAKKLPEYILSMSDDESFPAADVVRSENFNDALWALHIKPEHQNLWRKYAVWCARQVEHLMTDERSISVLDVAWRYCNGEATDEELAIARVDAWNAVREDVCAASNAAAWAVMDDARTAGGVTMEDVWDAVWAVRDAVWAARDAVGDAARDAIGAAQHKKLIEILKAGEWVD